MEEAQGRDFNVTARQTALPFKLNLIIASVGNWEMNS